MGGPLVESLVELAVEPEKHFSDCGVGDGAVDGRVDSYPKVWEEKVRRERKDEARIVDDFLIGKAEGMFFVNIFSPISGPCAPSDDSLRCVRGMQHPAIAKGEGGVGLAGGMCAVARLLEDGLEEERGWDGRV